MDQRRWADRHRQAVALQQIQRALGDRDLAQRGWVDVVCHHEPAPAQRSQVEDQRPELGGDALDRAVELTHPVTRAGAPEVERRGDRQHPITTRAQEAHGFSETALEARGVPAGRAYVVDPDVEAPDLVAGASAGCAALEDGNLRMHHAIDVRAVRRIARERQPAPARHPQRPGLQRDAPLQLAPAVGDRVTEGQQAELLPAG